ncbi:MAG: T9SS type A sorting domain-containing protein [Candidatus Krumholzibacteriota bacterium]|nr:T9SS type A sorting domain-containing protein [Candidatus Krumholzibacteriota bacterium]
MRSFSASCLLLFLGVSILAAAAAVASEIEWSVNGVAVCTSTGRQLCRHVLRDGRGGAFIGWMDERAGYDYPEYYVQKIDSSGAVQWTSNGVAVKSGNAPTLAWGHLRLAADGEGGVIVVWTMNADTQSPCDVYAQRIDADGNEVWTSGGELVYESYGSPLFPRIVSDWNGGAIVLFQDANLLAQRIGPDGEPLWENAVVVSNAYEGDYNYEMVADGEGGAFIAYANQNGDIMLYALDRDGGSSWFGGARTVCDADSLQFQPRIIADGAGGCIVTWYDARNHDYDPNPDEAEIYAQRYDADGTRLWASNGVEATPTLAITDLDYYSEYSVSTDDSCGVIIAVPDGGEVLASRVRCDGTRAWGANGVVVCAYESDCPHPCVAPDGRGGVVVAWCDGRSTDAIYAQRLDRCGQAAWTANGVAICSSNGEQHHPILTDGGIVAWYDFRNGNYDVYAQRLAHPSLQYVPACDLWAEYERDAGTVAADGDTFMCGCPGGDWDRFVVGVDLLDGDMEGPLVAGDLTMATCSAGGRYVFWLDPVHADSTATSGNGWETTLSDSCSSVDTPGPGDDCAADSLLVRFREFVLGHAGGIVVKSPDYNADGTVNLSDISFFGETYNKQRGDAGYNDYFDFNGDDRTNLSDYSFMGEHYYHGLPIYAPAPLYLATNGRAAAGARLATRRIGDRLCVTVRLAPRTAIPVATLGFDGSTGAVRFAAWEPNPSCAVASVATPVRNHGRDLILLSAFSLDNAEGGEIELGTMVFDVVGAADPDGVACLFGEALAADGSILSVEVAGVVDDVPPARNALGAAYPNPFNPTTCIAFSIDRDARVVLAVYDVTGALVRTLVNEHRPAARYSVVWDGTDDRGSRVASGVYFYRVKTAFFEQSRKMVLLR